jgi:hypothetical protein
MTKMTDYGHVKSKSDLGNNSQPERTSIFPQEFETLVKENEIVMTFPSGNTCGYIPTEKVQRLTEVLNSCILELQQHIDILTSARTKQTLEIQNWQVQCGKLQKALEIRSKIATTDTLAYMVSSNPLPQETPQVSSETHPRCEVSVELNNKALMNYRFKPAPGYCCVVINSLMSSDRSVTVSIQPV